MGSPLTEREIARELAPFQVVLPPEGLRKLARYLELLAHWNRRINLTAVREPRQMVRRLFGESLFLSRLVELEGRLVDVGSGAGFPGLALKLAAPRLRVTLVESRRKKCAFLKEVIRLCGFSYVAVVDDRFGAWGCRCRERGVVDIITTCAVAPGAGLFEEAASLLKQGGRMVLMTTAAAGGEIRRVEKRFAWSELVRIPGARQRGVLVGINGAAA